MLTDEQKKSLEWLDRLCEPGMYSDRLPPIRDYIKSVIAAHSARTQANVHDQDNPATQEINRRILEYAAQPRPMTDAARRFRHVKTGCNYRLICEGGMESDCTHVVVYQSEDAPHGIWVRPYAEFFDGRFAEIERGEREEYDK